jgi:hypothetical protein
MAANDLTTTTAVREYLQFGSGEHTETDALLATLVTATSVEIMRYTGCEFAPATASATRKFVYHGGGVLILAPYTLRTVSSITIDSDESNPTTLTTSDYRLRPIEPQNSVYTHLELRNLSPAVKTSSVDYRPTRQVSITGAWGYSSVPTDVAHACVLTVAFRFRNDSSHRGAQMGEDIPRFGPVQFPTAAKRILDHYRVRGVA